MILTPFVLRAGHLTSSLGLLSQVRSHTNAPGKAVTGGSRARTS